MMRRLWRSPKRIRPMELGWSQPSPRAQLGEPVNRKRAQRIMRTHRLLQPTRGLGRRRRPGYFRVRRPDELWHMDMTKVWTAQHGWVYLHAIVDCCTRELVAWSLDVRGRTVEALACVDTAMIRRSVARDRLTIGTDNGTQFTSRPFRSRLVEHGIVHRRGGYRDPESQAFIESWFGRFKKACRLARRVGNDRSSKERHRQLCERIPSAAPLRARLPDTRRGGPHLADTQQPSDLKPTTNQGSTSTGLPETFRLPLCGKAGPCNTVGER